MKMIRSQSYLFIVWSVSETFSFAGTTREGRERSSSGEVRAHLRAHVVCDRNDVRIECDSSWEQSFGVEAIGKEPAEALLLGEARAQ